MAITLVGSTTSHSNGVTGNITFALPTSLEGDVVVLAIGYAENHDDTVSVVTSGYTELAELYSDDSADVNLSVNYKVMGSTPDTQVECTGVPLDSRDAMYIAYVLRGVDSAQQIDVTTTTATGIDSGVPDPPSITPVTEGALVVICGVGSNSDNTSVTPPTGYSDQVMINSSPVTYEATMAMASKEWSSGAEDPGVWTDWYCSNNSFSAYAAVTLALRPQGPLVATVSGVGGAVAGGEAAELYFTGMNSLVVSGIGGAIAGGEAADVLTQNFLCSFDVFSPAQEASASLGGELFFSGLTPTTDIDIAFGTSFNISSPAMQAFLSLDEQQEISFDVKSSSMSGELTSLGFSFSGKSPEMQSQFSFDTDAVVGFSVKSPGITGSIELSSPISFDIKTPVTFATMEFYTEGYLSLSGQTPAMKGSLELSNGEMSFDLRTPQMQATLLLEEDTEFFFDIETPATTGNINLGLFAIVGTAITDLTPTSDEIIRHRRGYDNG